MKYVFFVLLIIFTLAIISLFLKIKVCISYEHKGEDDDLTIQFKVLRFLKYKIKVPLIAIDDESAAIVYEEERKSSIGEKNIKGKFTVQRFIDDIKNFSRFLKHVVGFHTIVKNFLKKVTIQEFQWKTVLGTGDAAMTGSISGILWGIKGNFIGIISNYMKLKISPQITIDPNFEQVVFKTTFKCMLSFRIGQAILAGIKVFRHWKKGRLNFSNSVDKMVGRNMNV